MNLSDLCNKELREQISKEEWDNFLSKYSFFMDQQVFTQLFMDFQRMHHCLRMACEDEKDEIRQEYDRDFLLEEGDRLYAKWIHHLSKIVFKEPLTEELRNAMIDFLNKELIQKRDNSNGK